MLSLLVAASLILGAGGLIAFTWRAVDREVSARETQLVRRALDRTTVRIARETTSASEWDDAFNHTAARDRTWMDLYLASYYRTSFAHDLSLVLDPAGQPVYAAEDGALLAASRAEAFASALAPVVRRVQREELQKRARLDRSRPMEVSSLAWRTTAAVIEGKVYLVGVSTVLPSRRLLTGAAPTMLVISGRRVDAAFLRELERDLGVVGASLQLGGLPPRHGAAPLVDDTGRTVATVTWRPARPGQQVIGEAAEALAALVLAIAVICALLFARILRLLRGLASKDRQLEESLAQLVQARDEARAGSRAKSQFIANISHEIRTPLNGVLGMAQAMANDELNERQRERLAIVRQSGESLLAILNDVLDLSKIEAGKLELEMAEFDLGALAAGAHAAFTALADRKGVDFSLTLSPEARGRYRSDPTRIRQILYNLISNALKFTERGQVTVSLSRPADRLVVEVADTGIGMPDEVRRRIFQSFQQADASTTRRFGGTGLGLAICRELADRLGGDIAVRSAPGRGSVFTVSLPLERVGDEVDTPLPAGGEQEPALEGLGDLRILVAEDNPVNQLVLKTLLHQVGLDPHVVPDGAQALQAWRGAPWDLVLMDVQMPVMDGVTATRRIREAEAQTGRSRTPILALTANAMSHQLAAYRECGMDGYVAKPLDLRELLLAIVEATAPEAAAAQPSDPAGAGAKSGLGS